MKTWPGFSHGRLAHRVWPPRLQNGDKTAPAPLLDPELDLALQRLRLTSMRRLAPQILQIATIQRWAPVEVLRTLVILEIVARDQEDQRRRLRAAGFAVPQRRTDTAALLLAQATAQHERSASRRAELASRLPWRLSQPSEPTPLPAALDAGLERLKLRVIRREAPEILHRATARRWAPAKVLRALVQAEIAPRGDAAQRKRFDAAGFPTTKTFAGLDLAASAFTRSTIADITKLDWVRMARNLCLLGPNGSGKSHLLIAAGHAAVAAGFQVRYLTTADLVDQLARGATEHRVDRVMDDLLRHDLILVDDLGAARLDDHRTTLLFRFVEAASERRRALGVASSVPVRRWTEFLEGDGTAQRLVDRLLHDAILVVTTGSSAHARAAHSFRPQEGRARAEARQSPVRTAQPDASVSG